MSDLQEIIDTAKLLYEKTKDDNPGTEQNDRIWQIVKRAGLKIKRIEALDHSFSCAYFAAVNVASQGGLLALKEILKET